MVSNIMNEAFQTSSPWMTFLLIINLILCLYPILGVMFWFFSALSYMVFRHNEELAPNTKLKKEPFITIMIPAHNEEIVIRDTLEYLLNELNYHNYEILVMDDGSTLKKIRVKLMHLILGFSLLRVNIFLVMTLIQFLSGML